MKNKSFFILAVSLLVSTNGMAQITQEDHLEPIGNAFTQSDRLLEKYVNIKQVLFTGLTDTPEIRYLILPSFDPESVLDIEFDKTKNEYVIVYHIAETMISGNSDWEHTKILAFKKSISKADATVIQSLFETAVVGTRYPEITKKPSNTNTTEKPKNPGIADLVGHVRLDGDNYFFFYHDAYNFTLKSGMIWSPSDGTRMGRLVGIADQLVKLVKSEKDTVVLPGELKSTMVNLTNELRTNNR